MKLYLVAPKVPANDEQAGPNARERECVKLMADLITAHLSPDPALFGMRHTGEVSDSPIQPEMRFGYAEVFHLGSENALRTTLLDCGDPNSGKWVLIRSLVTCRAVFYGYDAQAFVCLPTDCPPILSPNESLIRVEECSHLLIETDWMDGLIMD